MLSTVEKVLRLRNVDLLAGIAGDQLVPIADAAEEVSFGAGERIFAEGDAGDVLYLLVEGTVRVHRGHQEVARLSEGQCFGELSILDREPRSATCTAVTPVRLLAVGHQDFSDILQQSPELSLAIVRVLAKRLRGAVGKL